MNQYFLGFPAERTRDRPQLTQLIVTRSGYRVDVGAKRELRVQDYPKITDLIEKGSGGVVSFEQSDINYSSSTASTQPDQLRLVWVKTKRVRGHPVAD